jgi:type I restriction enzyme S subunit
MAESSPSSFELHPLTDLCQRTAVWNPDKEPRSRVAYVDVSAVSSERLRIVQPQKLNASDAPSRARKIVRTGDIIFATIRPALSRIALVPPELDGELASTAFCVIRPQVEKLLPEFAYYAVQADEFVQAVVRHERGASYPAVRDKDVLTESIPLPPMGEQRKIVAVLEKVQAAVEADGALVRLTRDLKQAALRQLFSCGLRGEPQRETRFGPVPESWSEEPLSGRAFVQTGIAKNSKNYRADDMEVPYLRVANVQDGRLDLSEIKTIRASARDVEASLLRDGDVVLTEGGDFDKLGRGFIWEGQIPQCVHQNHVFAVRTEGERLDPRFFAYLAQSPYGKAYFLSVAHKTTNLACINTTKLRAFPVLLPKLAEQREIAAHLATIDAKLAHHEARQKLLRELFRTLLRDLMTARRRVTDLDLPITPHP